MMLIGLGTLQTYKSGEYIFHQGDKGDLMYIIIRGGCHVRIKK